MPVFDRIPLLHSALAFALFGALLATTVGAAAQSAPTSGIAPAAKALPASVDLRPRFLQWNLPPRRQGPRGTCSVFTVTGALEYAAAAQMGHGSRLSVEFLNWAGHRAVHRSADGGFFSELWKGYEKFGICLEDHQPYQRHYSHDLEPEQAVLKSARTLIPARLSIHWIKEWNPHTGLTEAHVAEIKATLAKSWPVCGGFRWPKNAAWKEHVLQMCPPEAVFDGHSVLLVGYKDDPAQPGGGAFIIHNSGGDGTDGYLPYAYVAAYMNDAAWIGN